MKDIKKSKDGKYRLGRKQVVKLAIGLWAYKISGMLVVDVEPK